MYDTEENEHRIYRLDSLLHYRQWPQDIHLKKNILSL